MIISEKKLRKIISKIVSDELQNEGFLDRAYRTLGADTGEVSRMLGKRASGELKGLTLLEQLNYQRQLD